MGVILAITIGVLVAWLDIFFMASAPAPLKISFIVLGIVAYAMKNQPRLSLILSVSAAFVADLIVPLPWFGARLIGYAILVWLCRWLINSFFPANRPSAVWLLTFILSLVVKLSAIFYNFINYWWVGESAASLLSLANLVSALVASAATAAALAAIIYIFSRFDLMAKRWFLIRR